MTFSRGFEEGIMSLALSKAARVSQRFEGLCESPIEFAFATAFTLLIEDAGKRCEILRNGDETFKEFAAIAPQFRMGKYRVDFCICLKPLERCAIVECDGREFHHSTRAQIERDRERDQTIESFGHKVFRFPGAELHADPFNCAEQVLLWILRGPKHK